MAIRANHYRETEQRLQQDPIVRRMARDIAASGEPKSAFTHESGTPTHGFMGAANDQYRRLGGEDGGHIGAIATAVLAVAYAEDGEQ